jgi:hypothetical protein
MDANGHDLPSRRCAKCLMPMPDPDWVVNKVMAYCADCAALLHLGESKESRAFNDSTGGPIGPGPDSPPRPDPDAEDPEVDEEEVAA